jgi:outer membrane immunogenic protein
MKTDPLKTSALALAALASLGTADALGGPYEKRAKPTPVHQWTGFYIGGNLGYGVAGLTDNTPLAVTSNMTGIVGGVQAGYNYQLDSIVFGVEADIQASDQSTSYSSNVSGYGNFGVGQKIPWFGTARGKLGYAFDCGCVWAYGTLGVGYGAYEPSATAFGVTVSGHYERAVLAGGAGVEFMVGPRWSAKLEALYLDTGNVGSPITLPVFGPVSMRIRDAITRLGVNYHF